MSLAICRNHPADPHIPTALVEGANPPHNTLEVICAPHAPASCCKPHQVALHDGAVAVRMIPAYVLRRIAYKTRPLT
jgi:hypothetical protein